MDKKAMDKYQEDPRKYVALLAECFQKYNASSTMAGKLKTPLYKGRLHTAYSVGGPDNDTDEEEATDTGRLSSRKSIF